MSQDRGRTCILEIKNKKWNGRNFRPIVLVEISIVFGRNRDNTLVSGNTSLHEKFRKLFVVFDSTVNPVFFFFFCR